MIDIFQIFKDLIDNGISVDNVLHSFGVNAGEVDEALKKLKPAVISDINVVNDAEYVVYLNYVDGQSVEITQSYRDEIYPMSLTITNFSFELGEDVRSNLIKIINEIERLMYWYNKYPSKEFIYTPLQVNRLQNNSEFNLNVIARRNTISPIL